MKKIFAGLFSLAILSAVSNNATAQKQSSKDKSREVIILKNGDKDQKLTIETKDGKVFINGKPASEFKDGDVTVISGNSKADHNFLYTPGAEDFNFFDDDTTAGKKTFLGVTTDGVDNGAKITEVVKGSSAEKAGLKEGDVITKIGSKKISDPKDVSDEITSLKPKDEVTINYLRDGKEGETKARLGERSMRIRTFSFNNENMMKPFNFKMPMIQNAPNARSYRFFYNSSHRLGVKIEDAENESGAKITSVEDESAAAKAGLKKDDIITEVNGQKVKDVNEVRNEIAGVKDKTSYNVRAKRNGVEMNFEIKIPKQVNKADL